MTCLCQCHGGPGANPPPCDIPGGCGPCDGGGLPDGPQCGCARCERLPAPGWTVCGPHGRALGDHLAQLRTLWEQLDPAPSMQGREPGTGGGGVLPSQRSVGSLDVMAMRHRDSHLRDAEDPDGNNTPPVLATLLTWAATVRTERELTPPQIVFRPKNRAPGPVCLLTCGHYSCAERRALVFPLTLTFATERRLLADHADWILAQDWAGELCDEIRAARAGLEAATGHALPRRGFRCRQPVDGGLCGGVITWAAGRATCGGCGGVWSGLDVAKLGSDEGQAA